MKALSECNVKVLINVDGGFYRWNKNTKEYEKQKPPEKTGDCCGLFDHNKQTELKTFDDLKEFDAAVFKICDAIGVIKSPYHRNIRYLCRSYANKVLNDSIEVKDVQILETIDEASGGGCLLTKTGKHEGTYTCYDINNSYNRFFIDFYFPTNPRFSTLAEIGKIKEIRLYHVKVDEPFLCDEWNTQLKTRRHWVTGFDLMLYDKVGITYKLVNEENNVICFDVAETDFSDLQEINKIKQSAKKGSIAQKTLKLFLSSFWGSLCQFDYISGEACESIDSKYFFKVRESNGEHIFKNPECIYRYPTAIAKPFIMAYARKCLYEMVMTCVNKGFNVVYCHTDSIITNAPESLFDIGTGIGQWKIDKRSDAGVYVKNIASKTFLTSEDL